MIYERTIHKYELEITDVQTIEMPVGSEILSIQEQRDHLVLWAIVYNDVLDQLEPHKFYVVGTGNPVPEPDDDPDKWPAALVYCATVQTKGGRAAWHVFTEIDIW